MNGIKKIIKSIIIVLVVYSIFGLFMDFVFSYGNQSPYQERKLTLFNFVIPYLITVGFMIYASILLYKKPMTVKSTWIILCFAGILEIISIKLQVEFFIWKISKNDIGEIIPILTGIIMTIYIFVTLIRIILKKQKNQNAVNSQTI